MNEIAEARTGLVLIGKRAEGLRSEKISFKSVMIVEDIDIRKVDSYM